MNDGFEESDIELIKDTSYINDFNASLHIKNVEKTKISKFSCFSFQLTNETILDSSWMRLTNDIAINYIADLDRGFSKWNCYIIFFCLSEVSKKLKFEIENNKFAARKIVISGLDKLLSADEIGAEINKLVLDTNIKLNHEIVRNTEHLQLSGLAERLLEANPPLDKKDSSIKKRQDWIQKELRRILKDEN